MNKLHYEEAEIEVIELDAKIKTNTNMPPIYIDGPEYEVEE